MCRLVNKVDEVDVIEPRKDVRSNWVLWYNINI